MGKKQQITLEVVNRRCFAWSLVAAALFLLVISVLASWAYYQSLLKERPHFDPIDNQTINTLQNATGNVNIYK